MRVFRCEFECLRSVPGIVFWRPLGAACASEGSCILFFHQIVILARSRVLSPAPTSVAYLPRTDPSELNLFATSCVSVQDVVRQL